jgi:hypothetical protein
MDDRSNVSVRRSASSNSSKRGCKTWIERKAFYD